MRSKLKLGVTGAALALLCACGGPQGSLTIRNLGSGPVSVVQVNVVKRVTPDFLSQPAGPHDQLLRTVELQPGASARIEYAQIDEGNIDVRAEWPDGSSARYNVGYVDDLFYGLHEIVVADGTITFDGLQPSEAQRDPKAHFSHWQN